MLVCIILILVSSFQSFHTGFDCTQFVSMLFPVNSHEHCIVVTCLLHKYCTPQDGGGGGGWVTAIDYKEQVIYFPHSFSSLW